MFPQYSEGIYINCDVVLLPQAAAAEKRGVLFCRQTKGPILSCFTEITDLAEDDTPEFKKVRYTLHVLGALYPNPEKSVKENTEQLVERLKAGHPIAIYPEAPV